VAVGHRASLLACSNLIVTLRPLPASQCTEQPIFFLLAWLQASIVGKARAKEKAIARITVMRAK